jgi:hypothetical protein
MRLPGARRVGQRVRARRVAEEHARLRAIGSAGAPPYDPGVDARQRQAHVEEHLARAAAPVGVGDAQVVELAAEDHRHDATHRLAVAAAALDGHRAIGALAAATGRLVGAALRPTHCTTAKRTCSARPSPSRSACSEFGAAAPIARTEAAANALSTERTYEPSPVEPTPVWLGPEQG